MIGRCRNCEEEDALNERYECQVEGVKHDRGNLCANNFPVRISVNGIRFIGCCTPRHKDVPSVVLRANLVTPFPPIVESQPHLIG